MTRPLWVDPTNNRDKVGDERGNVALEEHVVKQQHIFHPNIGVIALDYGWKENVMFRRKVVQLCSADSLILRKGGPTFGPEDYQMCFDQRNSWSPQNQPRQGRRRNRRWRKGCCIGREHHCSAKHSPFQHLCHNSVQPLKKILSMSFARRIRIIFRCRKAHLKQFVLLNDHLVYLSSCPIEFNP